MGNSSVLIFIPTFRELRNIEQYMRLTTNRVEESDKTLQRLDKGKLNTLAQSHIS